MKKYPVHFLVRLLPVHKIILRQLAEKNKVSEAQVIRSALEYVGEVTHEPKNTRGLYTPI